MPWYSSFQLLDHSGLFFWGCKSGFTAPIFPSPHLHPLAAVSPAVEQGDALSYGTSCNRSHFQQPGGEITTQPHALYGHLLSWGPWPLVSCCGDALLSSERLDWCCLGGCSFASPTGLPHRFVQVERRGDGYLSVTCWGEHRVCCRRHLIIWRSISLFLIKYKDYLTVIISVRWLRIKGAASKACLGEAKARFAASIINHQESLFS